ncbi:MAG: hypothetical protein K2O39_00205, partial [Clostridiales bacterium]|nr:hypothetical protein [Clostridiales bacterium]
TQYGVRGNLTTVNDDNLEKDLSITVPYYTMSGSKNNQSIQVKFQQLSKYNPSSKEYAKLTSVETAKNGPMTDDITVTSSDESVISINEDTITNEGFSFTANKSSNNQYVTISIKANVYNDNADEITKTIRVKVDSNVALGYVDSMYVFNKPIVDAEFIGKVQKGGDTSVVDSQELKKEIAKDKTVKTVVFNDTQVLPNSDFALELPYSYTSSVTYNDIFKHILLNPCKIQYDGEEITTAWYKDIEVRSSDSSVLLVTTASDGSVKLQPRNVSGAGKCNLIFTDKKSGSAGASITVPVRIVAQTTDVELACGNDKTDAKRDIADIEVVAAVDGKYEVNVTYTFVAPEGTPKTLAAEDCLNNKYKLSFDKNEMDVTLKGSTTKLDPNKEYSADYG